MNDTPSKYDDDDLQAMLLDYAAGAMDEALSLMMASLVTICPEARQIVRDYEAMAGVMLDQECGQEKMSLDSLNRVLGKIDLGSRNLPVAQAPAKTPDPSVPQAVCKHLQLHQQSQIRPVGWRRSCPGVEVMDIPVDNSNHCAALVRIAPSRKIVWQRNGTTELTLILSGSLQNEDGIHKRGDITVSRAGTAKPHIADEKDGCTCMVVRDRPVRVRTTFSFFGFFIRG